MGARTAIKTFGRKVGDVRYIGRLARISAAVWRAPYTAATLYELKQSLGQIVSLQQGISGGHPLPGGDAAVSVKLDAIADGYGSALTGIEKALRMQEQQIADLRGELAAQAHLPQQVSEMQATISVLQQELSGRATAAPGSEVTALKQQSTELSNTVNSIAEKIGWISVDNDNIRARLEFIRTEVMFELRKQMQVTKATSTTVTDPATKHGIINYEKVSAAGPKRLNLGSGHVPKDGYINVDFRAVPGVDVVGDVTALEFPHGTIDAIFASHLIEHFPVRALGDVVLPHWRDLLRPGGKLMLIAPDAAAMLDAYRDGVFNFDELREVLYGGQEYEGDFHFNMLSPDSATELLTQLGFVSVRIEAAGRRNGNCLEFEIHAEKPES